MQLYSQSSKTTTLKRACLVVAAGICLTDDVYVTLAQFVDGVLHQVAGVVNTLYATHSKSCSTRFNCMHTVLGDNYYIGHIPKKLYFYKSATRRPNLIICAAAN